MVDLEDKDNGQGAQQRRNPPLPPLGVIEVIYAASRGIAMAGSR